MIWGENPPFTETSESTSQKGESLSRQVTASDLSGGGEVTSNFGESKGYGLNHLDDIPFAKANPKEGHEHILG